MAVRRLGGGGRCRRDVPGGAQPESVAAELRGGLLLRPVPRSRGEGKDGPGAHSCAGTRPELSRGGGFWAGGAGLVAASGTAVAGRRRGEPGVHSCAGTRPELLSGGGFWAGREYIRCRKWLSLHPPPTLRLRGVRSCV